MKLVSDIGDTDHLAANAKSFNYHISWMEPLEPNGLIYFYVIHIGQERNNGPKEERCVGNDVHWINVTLQPRTTYRLRIITYTIARLNNEYGEREQINEEQSGINSTNLFYEYVFRTEDLSSKERIECRRFVENSFFFSGRINSTESPDLLYINYWINHPAVNYYSRCASLLL